MRQRPAKLSAWVVYLLRCADDTLYCGCTNDLDRRLLAHARGRVKYTRGRLPVAVAHVESVPDKSAALRREHQWKRLSRAQKLARISNGETKGRLRRSRKFVMADGCGKLQA
ncbi:MAG TPA: GIY-YIG nuclease family protein [Polyangia bacterium]|nr:GIY-YIG nuclease family protein [Polyangia bacterium]